MLDEFVVCVVLIVSDGCGALELFNVCDLRNKSGVCKVCAAFIRSGLCDAFSPYVVPGACDVCGSLALFVMLVWLVLVVGFGWLVLVVGSGQLGLSDSSECVREIEIEKGDRETGVFVGGQVYW